MEKYKTIHENKNDLEQFWFDDLDLSVRALNNIKEARVQSREELLSLTELDTLKLKFGRKTISEISELKNMYKPSSNPNDVISNLDRYECTSNSGGQDCWSTMEKSLDGEYVLFSDVIKAVSILFSAKKQ